MNLLTVLRFRWPVLPYFALDIPSSLRQSGIVGHGSSTTAQRWLRLQAASGDPRHPHELIILEQDVTFSQTGGEGLRSTFLVHLQGQAGAGAPPVFTVSLFTARMEEQEMMPSSSNTSLEVWFVGQWWLPASQGHRPGTANSFSCARSPGIYRVPGLGGVLLQCGGHRPDGEPPYKVKWLSLL